MRPLAKMLGLAHALNRAPALAPAKRLLRQIVVPGVHDHAQRRQRGEVAMQRRRLDGRAERLLHRGHHRLAVLEILDELRRRRRILANLVRHARLGGEPVRERFERGGKRAILSREGEDARPEIGNGSPALQARADCVDGFGCHGMPRQFSAAALSAFSRAGWMR